MATNNIKPFATGAGANVTSQADWEALPALSSGFLSGKASSAQINKAIRQALFIASALAQYTSDKSGLDVLDDGDVPGFIAKMEAAFGEDFQPLNANLNALAGLTGVANKFPIFTGEGAMTLADLSAISAGRLIGAPKIITSSGTYTPSAGTKSIIFECVGGGGGGGGCVAASSSAHLVSAGGGAGGTAMHYVSTLASSYAISIGAGGAAGTTSGTVGGDGGTTSVGTICVATGGKGGGGGNSGAVSSSNTLVSSGGKAGAGTAGNLRQGAYESAGVAVAAFQSNVGSGGGSTPYGQGGLPTGTSTQGAIAGNSGSGYGAGGSGCASYGASGATSAVSGGAGTQGLVIVWEFA